MKHQRDQIPTDESMAFEEVLTRYKGLLFRICKKFSNREMTVEDLMQEIALTLWRKRARLWLIPDGMQRAAWLWKVGRNVAVDNARRTPGHQQLENHINEELTTEDKTLNESLHEQINLLDDPDRTIVKMQLEGFSYDEIASRTGMTVKNVSVRLVRVKEKLRKSMNDDTTDRKRI